MTATVVDASVFGPLLLPDEGADLHPALHVILRSGHAVVPQHWRLEIANFGLMAVRRGRVSAAELALGLNLLARSSIAEDSETALHAWQRTLQLSTQHRLTVYDAAYLELALRRRLPLLTLDRELGAAARAEAVELVPV